MDMKKVSLVTVASIAVLLAIALSVPIKRHVRAQSGAAPVPAFQIWLTASVTSPITPVANPTKVFIGQNSNGDTIHTLDTDKIRYIEFPSQGIAVNYFPANNTKMTTGNGIPHPPHFLGLNCEAVPNQTGETKTILGFNTLHVLFDAGVNGVTDEWIAPDLNCEPLLKTYTLSGSVNTQIATAAVATPPDQSLFAVPPDAQEQPPSVFYPGAGMHIPGAPNLTSAYARDAAARSAAGN